MQDPIADMLARIRNAQQAKHAEVNVSSSRLKVDIVKVLKEEGYILDFNVFVNRKNFNEICIKLKYYQGKPVIEKIIRISKPGLRVYKASKMLKRVPGFGISILSTSKGVMSHSTAKKNGLGGEILCEVA